MKILLYLLNMHVSSTACFCETYLISSRYLDGTIKSSIGISSGGTFSILLSFFLRRSLASTSRFGSTFFFFLVGSALLEQIYAPTDRKPRSYSSTLDMLINLGR